MKIYQAFFLALGALLFVDCSSSAPQIKSPTEVLRTLNEASKTKDVEAVKKSISKGTLDLIEQSAKAQNLTVDEMLKKDNGAPFKELPEMRGEKIDGDAATVELKNTSTDGWETVPFVKEDGSWRLALDKYLKGMQKMAESAKAQQVLAENKSGANSSRTDGDKKPENASNKTAKSK